MADSPYVIAVVVTYNRHELLGRTLAALEAQARRLDRLVIVDNASTDETSAVLAAFVADVGHERAEVLRLPSNAGGAGGYHVGMRRALELGADWVWTLDDDVAPDVGCLEELLAHSDLSECLHPQRIGMDGTPQPWEPMHSLGTGATTLLDNVSFANGKSVTYTNVACFEGALTSRRVIEIVGLPDPAFFIVGDDTAFGLKASTHTNVAIVRDARMQRLLPVASFAPWKVYYLARNAFLVRRQVCDFLEVEPTRVENVVFHVNLLLELSRHARRGARFWPQIVRGVRDGRAYERQAQESHDRPRDARVLADG